MTENKSKNNQEYVSYLLFALAIYALFRVVPGFLPKQIRDIVLGFATFRGLTCLMAILMVSLLLPAAFRLYKSGYCSFLTSGLMSIFGVIILLDLMVDSIFRSALLDRIVIRIAYGAFVGWGLYGLKDFFQHIKNKKNELKTGLTLAQKVLLFILLFFLFRQQLHLYLTRGSPFQPFGDEIAWWWPMSTVMLKQGIVAAIDYAPYTPALGWLNALTGRLLGTVNTEWLFVVPMISFAGFLFIIFELSTTSVGLLASLVLLCTAMFSSVDLHHLFAGTIYGEAFATLSTAVLYANLYLIFKDGFKEGIQKFSEWPMLIGTAFLLNFICLSKPPISMLAYFLTPVFAMFIFKNPGALILKLKKVTVFCAYAFSGILLWRQDLRHLNKVTEHNVSFTLIREIGVDLSVPIGMIEGLLNKGSPQLAFTIALFFTFVLVLMQKAKALFRGYVVLLVLYWGFVFCLYATVWQHWEKNSAGRYLSHSAMASAILITLAFNRRGGR